MHIRRGSGRGLRAGGGFRRGVGNAKEAFGFSPSEEVLRQEVGITHERGSELVGGLGG